MSTTIVSTTIGDGVFLEHYVRAFRVHGIDDVTMIAIPDLKTPGVCFEVAERLSGDDVTIVCPTLEEQEDYLNRLGLPAEFVPKNSDNRRNVGFLMALELGNEVVVSIDDDNFCMDGADFIAEHSMYERIGQGKACARPAAGTTSAADSLSLLSLRSIRAAFPTTSGINQTNPCESQRRPALYA